MHSVFQPPCRINLGRLWQGLMLLSQGLMLRVSRALEAGGACWQCRPVRESAAGRRRPRGGDADYGRLSQLHHDEWGASGGGEGAAGGRGTRAGAADYEQWSQLHR